MLKVWRDKSQAIALLSDDERFMITGFINNIPEGDPRNSYKHWLNGRWNMYEGKWRNEWRKTMPKTEDDRLIAKNLKSKSSILAIAFASGRYKKAISDFMKTCGKKKGNVDYSDEVGEKDEDFDEEFEDEFGDQDFDPIEDDLEDDFDEEGADI